MEWRRRFGDEGGYRARCRALLGQGLVARLAVDVGDDGFVQVLVAPLPGQPDLALERDWPLHVAVGYLGWGIAEEDVTALREAFDGREHHFRFRRVTSGGTGVLSQRCLVRRLCRPLSLSSCYRDRPLHMSF